MRSRVLLAYGALIAASAWCGVLLAVRKVEFGYFVYAGLVWNLVLAWVPLVLASLLVVSYRRGRSRVELLAVGFAWLDLPAERAVHAHGLHPPRPEHRLYDSLADRVVRVHRARARLRVALARAARRHACRRRAGRLAHRGRRAVRGEHRHLPRARPSLQQLGCRPPSWSPVGAGAGPDRQPARQPASDRLRRAARRLPDTRIRRSLRSERAGRVGSANWPSR